MNMGFYISKKSLSNYFAILRKMVSVFLVEFLPMIQLPGPVEVDETFIGARRRGDHGRIPARHLVVFGIFNVYFSHKF